MKTTSNDSAGIHGSTEATHTRINGSTGASPSQLLVSVRSEQEINEAIAGGADIVDLKEPSDGALAPTSLQLWQAAARLASDSKFPPLSAALGESADALGIAQSLPAGFQFAKVGPSGQESADDLRSLWSAVRDLLDPSIELVAVAYADHQAGRCLRPETIFSLAAEFGFLRCLVDTFIKDGQSTKGHLGIDGLFDLSRIAKKNGLWWALAGSICLEDAIAVNEQIARNGLGVPDCYGVRGDVCDQGRGGRLSIDRVRRWKESSLKRTNQVPLGS